MKFRNRAAMPSRPLCLISFLSLEDVLLDCQHATKLTQPAKNCRIYFNKVKLVVGLPEGSGNRSLRLLFSIPLFGEKTPRRSISARASKPPSADQGNWGDSSCFHQHLCKKQLPFASFFLSALTLPHFFGHSRRSRQEALLYVGRMA